MKLTTLLESEKVGATLFFNCDFYYDGFYDDNQKKNGEIRITVVFQSLADSTDFIQKCRTSIMESFFKDFMENGGCETWMEEIVNSSSSAAEEFNVLRITKVDIDGDMAMSSARTQAYVSPGPKQNENSAKWIYHFFFDDLEKFVKSLAWGSGEGTVNRHFGSVEGLLDTLTL